MFGYRSTPQETSSLSSVLAANDRQDDAFALRACIDTLLQNKTPDLSKLSEEDRHIVSRLSAHLRTTDKTALEGAVDTSIATSQIQASVSNAYQDITELRNESQIMASAIQELESSFSQITDSANHIDAGLQQAASDTRTTADEVDKATQSVRKTSENLIRIVTDMQQLEDAASHIRSMSQTIEQIAGQTNLLALNATIEAARAGDAGRGFAVVASEVKSLSMQTAKTTDQIAERIQNLEAAIETIVTAITDAQSSAEIAELTSTEANKRVQSTTENILASSEAVSSLAGVISDQKLATAELARGVERIAGQSNEAQGKLESTVQETAATETIVAHQFEQLEKRNVQNFILYKAKSDHILWKKRLSALLSGMASLNQSELSDHHSCQFGKWWDQERGGEHYSIPAFKQIEKPHETVHQAGRRAAELFHKGDKVGARSAYAEMEAASSEVVRQLDTLILAIENQ